MRLDMKKIGLLVVLISSTVIATAYRCQEYGVSVEIPEGFTTTDVSSLSDEDLEFMALLATSNPVLIVHKDGKGAASFPSLLFHYKKFKRTTNREAVAAYNCESGREKMLGSTEFLAKLIMGEMEKDFTKVNSESYYDSDNRFAYAMLEYDHKRGKKLIAIVVRLLGDREMVELRCYWRGKDPSSFIKLVDDFVQSIEMDSVSNIEDSDYESSSSDSNKGSNEFLEWILFSSIGTIIVFVAIRKIFSS